MLTAPVRIFLKRAAPGLFAHLKSVKDRRHILRFYRSQGVTRVTSEYLKAHPLKVQAGPFAGLLYKKSSAGSSLLPKLIGSYEAELASTIEEIAGTAYEIIVDVGSAEGYYAVGLATRVQRARIYAFDTDPYARHLCREIARLNSVSDRVVVKGRCDPKVLQGVLKGRALVVCDCEGYEFELLDPAKAPALQTADILVELHEWCHPDLSDSIFRRFSATHSIRVIRREPRDPRAYTSIASLASADQSLALNEYRPDQQSWGWMTALGLAPPTETGRSMLA